MSIWLDYLDTLDETDRWSYDGSCECFNCRHIRDGFRIYELTKEHKIMNTNEVENGQEYWAVNLKCRVTVLFLDGDYAYCRDEDNNSYSIHVNNLRPLDWNPDMILEREA